MPLVGAEVQRVRSAFVAVSAELDAVRQVLRQITAEVVGTPDVDAAVEHGISDLNTAVHGLREQSEACVSVTARHFGEAADGNGL